MSNLALNKNEKNNKEDIVLINSEQKSKLLKLNLEELIFIDDSLTLMLIKGPYELPISKSYHNLFLIPANYELIYNVMKCINYLKKSEEKECFLETSDEDLFTLREVSKSQLSLKNNLLKKENDVSKNLKFKVCELLADDYELFKKNQQAKKFLDENLFNNGEKV